ncbi:uncharacterized protein [Musca autumnalis]|uniref:uncharacterized protein n=1 Tax=Musca autumnalis TaxID=221902 RepID=UPI003CEBD8ED
MLLIGIYQNRHRLMSVYVNITLFVILISIFGVLVLFVRDLFMRKKGAEGVEDSIILGLLAVGFQILIFTPIFVHYKRVRKGNEQCPVTTNQILNKPNNLYF